MRIIVCAKQIRHVFARSGREPEHNYITDGDAISCINPYDEAALELALCVKDATEGVEVLLLGLGPVIAESDLRRCLAMGADQLWQVDMSEGLDGWSKSLLLADAVRELEGSLIFCGERSADSQNGHIGPFLAAHLALPFVSRVTDVTLSQEGSTVRAERNGGKGKREIVECGLPAVLSACLGPKIPRYPRYEMKRRLGPLPIRKLDSTRPAIPSRIISTRVFSPRPRPRQVSAPDSSLPAAERIEQLLSGSNAQKQGEILFGEPRQQVEKIIRFLQEKEFLKRAGKES